MNKVVLTESEQRENDMIKEEFISHLKTISYKNIQQIINECVDRCLRKYLRENVKINEARQQANQTDKGFERWKKVFDGYLSEMVNELQADYLSNLHLTININPNYAFNGGRSRWLAAYEGRSRQIENGIVSIAINYPLLYSKMRQMHTDKDRLNIEAQARITVGHEIGHGLVDYIKLLSIEPSMLSEMPNVKTIMYCGGRKEEKLVEEFGEYQFTEVTGCWGSVLCDALEELNSIDNNV